MFLWLRCEGWVRFGPYEGLQFDRKHNVITGTGEPVALFRHNSGVPLWSTPGQYANFDWVKPVLTNGCRGPYADRVYVIHAPMNFKPQCARIQSTCQRAFVINDSGELSRREVMKLVLSEADAGNLNLRLSVYTRDETLAAELEEIDLRVDDRVAYFGIHRIEARGPQPWETSRRTRR